MSCAHAPCNAPAEQWGASPTARARHRQKTVGALFMASLKRKGGAVARERAVVVRDRRGAVGGKTHALTHRHTYSPARLTLSRTRMSIYGETIRQLTDGGNKAAACVMTVTPPARR